MVINLIFLLSAPQLSLREQFTGLARRPPLSNLQFQTFQLQRQQRRRRLRQQRQQQQRSPTQTQSLHGLSPTIGGGGGGARPSGIKLD